jgi:hypothetical protein
MNSKPRDLNQIIALCLATLLGGSLVVLAAIPKVPRAMSSPSPIPPFVITAEVPISRWQTWCPPPELRGEPDPSLTLPTEYDVSVIQTELHSFATLVGRMLAKRRSGGKIDSLEAEFLERQVDARVREILGKPAQAGLSDFGEKMGSPVEEELERVFGERKGGQP